MSTASETRSAYELLSKPTLELSDEEITAICKDLRTRRERFLAGQKDNQRKPTKEKAEVTPESKAQASAEVLNEIGNLF